VRRGERFVAAARRIVPERYPDTKGPSYTSIIDDKSHRRLRETLEDAVARGANAIPLVPGASFDDGLRKVPPHLVLDPSDDMRIMRDEISGPLLPVKTYRDLDEVIAYVNAKDRPLGFYVFTNDRKREEKLPQATISGGVSINNCMLHVAQHDLPFGGVGASGMGQYHGFEGFVEFSKLRPVFTNPRLSLHLLYPPYRPRHRRMIDALLRWGR
jgi:coniferyl-aldehyde dehydrogenase